MQASVTSALLNKIKLKSANTATSRFSWDIISVILYNYYIIVGYGFKRCTHFKGPYFFLYFIFISRVRIFTSGCYRWRNVSSRVI